MANDTESPQRMQSARPWQSGVRSWCPRHIPGLTPRPAAASGGLVAHETKATTCASPARAASSAAPPCPHLGDKAKLRAAAPVREAPGTTTALPTSWPTPRLVARREAQGQQSTMGPTTSELPAHPPPRVRTSRTQTTTVYRLLAPAAPHAGERHVWRHAPSRAQLSTCPHPRPAAGPPTRPHSAPMRCHQSRDFDLCKACTARKYSSACERRSSTSGGSRQAMAAALAAASATRSVSATPPTSKFCPANPKLVRACQRAVQTQRHVRNSTVDTMHVDGM